MRRAADESMNVQSFFGLSNRRINPIGERLSDMIEPEAEHDC
jgi:hypothetical protein